VCNQLQAGFLTCVLPRDSFPSSTNFVVQYITAIKISAEQWIKISLGFPIHQSEQTLTAARPPRILTVFPFDYPKANLQDLQSGYILVKEQKNVIKLAGNGQIKIIF